MSEARVRIWSNVRGAWWRPNSHGYTEDLAKAGLYPREEAQDIVDKTHGENELRSHCNSSLPPSLSEETAEKQPDWYWLAPDKILHAYHPTQNSIVACGLDWDGWERWDREDGEEYTLCGECRKVFEKPDEAADELQEPGAPLLVIHDPNYCGPVCPKCGSDYPKRFLVVGPRRCVNDKCERFAPLLKVPDIPAPPPPPVKDKLPPPRMKAPVVEVVESLELKLAAASLREDELRKDLSDAQLTAKRREHNRDEALACNRQLLDDQEELLLYRTQHERLKGELNEALHPNGDGPEAPSFCDLVAFVRRDLKDLKEARESVLTAAMQLDKANTQLVKLQDDKEQPTHLEGVSAVDDGECHYLRELIPTLMAHPDMWARHKTFAQEDGPGAVVFWSERSGLQWRDSSKDVKVRFGQILTPEWKLGSGDPTEEGAGND